MSVRNLVPAALGLFQTRSTRTVHITGSELVTVPAQGAEPARQKRVFIGTLFKMDGRTVDQQLRWEEDGSLVNQRGVSSDKDLCAVIRLDTPPPSAEPPAAVPIDQGHVDDLIKTIDAMEVENHGLRDELRVTGEQLTAAKAENEKLAARVAQLEHDLANAQQTAAVAAVETQH